MSGSQRHGHRLGLILLGLLAIGASMLWTLFWIVLVWWSSIDYTLDLVTSLFSGAMLAIGLVVFVVGVFLVAGRFPGRRGWLLVGVLSLVPLVALALQGPEKREHLDAVTFGAEQAYAARSGRSDVDAQCVWEYDEEAFDRWRFDMGPATIGDRCFIEVTKPGAGRVTASIDRCERDEAVVGPAVEQAYVKRGGVTKVTECVQYDADPGSWRCQLGPTAADKYCFVDAARWYGGRVDVSISHCERDITSAVNSAYARRTGVRNATATCVENQDERWTCKMGLAPEHDRCAVAITRSKERRVSARIAYCERELAAEVNEIVARFYTKRTGIENVTAECALVEPSFWACGIESETGNDRCRVAIDNRSAGPRVTYWATSCKSGRL